MRPPLLFEALRVTCLHVVLEHVNDSSLIFFIILVSVQRSEESFRYNRVPYILLVIPEVHEVGLERRVSFTFNGFVDLRA